MVLDEASNTSDVAHYRLRADIDELQALLETPNSGADASSLLRLSVGIHSRASDVLTDAALIAEALVESASSSRSMPHRQPPDGRVQILARFPSSLPENDSL